MNRSGTRVKEKCRIKSDRAGRAGRNEKKEMSNIERKRDSCE